MYLYILIPFQSNLDARAIDPRHATRPITNASLTNLSEEKCFRSEKGKIWAFGHKHYNCDFTVEQKDGASSIRLLGNQRGYYFSQADRYEGGKKIDI